MLAQPNDVSPRLSYTRSPYTIAELRKHLIEMIAEDISWDVDSRRSLARLARTSKGFSEDALNALWFELQDLLPVILLLPSDAIEVSWEYGIREVKINRPLCPSDYAGVRRNAWRVRGFRFSVFSLGREHLSLCALNTPIFPRLRKLTRIPPTIPSMVPSLMSVSLEELHIKTEDWPRNSTTEHDCKLLINSILYTAPNLRSLTWQIMGYRSLSGPFSYASSFSTVATLLPHLEVVRCDLTVGLPSICRLATSQNLEWLGLHLELHPVEFELPVQSFPALRGLEVTGRPANVLSLLSQTTSPHVQTVHLNFERSNPDPRQFAALISSQYSRTLSYVYLKWAGYSRIAEAHTTFDFSVFEPLYACRQIKVAYFKVRGHQVEVHTKHLVDMAAAWPDLQSLSIYEGRSHPWPNISLHDLHDFTRRCQSLTRLSIPIDASVATIDCTEPYACRRSPLRSLHLQRSVCGNANSVSRFLNHAFPHLARITAARWKQKASSRVTPVSQGKWDDVVEELSGYTLLPNGWYLSDGHPLPPGSPTFSDYTPWYYEYQDSSQDEDFVPPPDTEEDRYSEGSDSEDWDSDWADSELISLSHPLSY